MADPPRRGDAAGVGAEGVPPPGMPRWVKRSLIVVAVLVLVVVIMMLLSGGGHGPSRHAPGIQVPPVSVAAHFTLFGGGPGGHTPSAFSHR
jgi:hypothetical protein